MSQTLVQPSLSTDANIPPPTSRVPNQPQQRSTKPKIDPFALVSTELAQLRTSMLTLMGSAHPGLTQIAEYYFLQPSKQLRPLLVLLFSRATNGLGQDWALKSWNAELETKQ
ncbi:9419_t:CDS:1, partial [Acaulospora colombiana]